MKFPGGRREWALGMAFMLCMVFLYIMHFLTSLYINHEIMPQVNVFSIIGSVAGALFLPFILPLGALRQGRRPPKYFQRLVLLGFLFFPIVILNILGLNSWMSSSINVVVRGFTNGIIIALVQGLFISLAGKHRNLWAGLSISISLFVFYLVLSMQRQYMSDFAPVLFYGSGLLMVLTAVFLFLYLSAVPAGICGNAPGGTGEPSGPQLPAATMLPDKKRFPGFLLPLFAMAVIFWTNSFTERLFMPVFHLPPGFYVTNTAMMLTLPIAAFLADLSRQKFFNVFILFSFGVFLLAPSLLLFNQSETIFLVLYTLNATSIQLIVAVFPFAILDLYWKESRPGGHGYWAWLLAVSTHLFRVLAGAQIGLFSALPVNDRYAVLLLSLTVIVYFVFSLKLVKFQADKFVIPDASTILPSVPPEEDFREHGLSKREMEIGHLILQGQTNKEIAEKISVQEDTVKKHTYSIFDKYNVKRRTEFMAKVLNREQDHPVKGD
jgi:DNA-binding CsgD family transcriptional regulator